MQLTLLAAAVCAATYIRSAISPLQEALRGSLALSDDRIALLQGMAMAIPIALASIPFGLLADRTARLRILIFSMWLAVASLVLSAFATDFRLLLVARCLTGLSLPGILVASYSMAGDLFTPGERGRATMVMGLGEIAGAPAAFALGGALLVMVGSTPGMRLAGWDLDSWRWSLLWMSVGLVPVLLLTGIFLREPPRTEVATEKRPLRMVLPELWRHRSVAVPLQLARATLFIADGAVFVWGAPMFARDFRLEPDHIGAMMGTVLLISGVLGPALGGPLVDICQRRGGPRSTMRLMAVIALLSVPAALFPLMPNSLWASVVLGAFLTMGFGIGSAALALTLIVIPGELRGLNLGFSIVVGSLFFVGLAPLSVSSLAGWLGGEAMIGGALAIVCAAASLLSAAVFAVSARHFPCSGRNESDDNRPVPSQIRRQADALQ